ncbi:MAG: hypothetical protein WDM70_00185 [Nitrosomonadales bacterium]
MSGYFGSLATGGTQEDARVAAATGALIGGAIGYKGPEIGLAAIGAISAEVSDIVAQEYTILNYTPPANTCPAQAAPTYNPYQTIGAGIGGLVAGLFPGAGLAPLIAGGQMSFMTVTAGTALGMKIGGH